jgi:hypothetical protein
MAQFGYYRRTTECKNFRDYIELYPSIEKDGLPFIIIKYSILVAIYLIFEFLTLLIIFPLTTSTYTQSPNIWYNITMITMTSTGFLGFFLFVNSILIDNAFELKE